MAVKELSIKNKDEKIFDATLDEAMLLTGCGLCNILHTLLSGIILMGVIMQNLALSYVMPAAQCDLDLTMQQRGWLATLPFAAMILTSFFWGWLADTRGRRPVMLYSMQISVVFSLITSFAPNLISFAVLQFISSIFTSAASALIYTYLGEFHNLRHRDKMLAFGSSFIGIGTVLLPGLAWLILPLDFYFPIGFLNITYRPWRLLVVACAIPFVIGSIGLVVAPESPKFLNAVGRQEDCLEVLKTVYSINKRRPKDSYPVKSLLVENQASKEAENSHGVSAVLRSMRDQTVPLFRRPLLQWICLIFLVQFGIFITTNGFYIWLPVILNSLANHEGDNARICDILDAVKEPETNGTVLECIDAINTETFERSIYIGLIFLSMYFIVGFLVDFVGKKFLLVVVQIVAGLCCLGAHLVSDSLLGVVMLAIFQMVGACVGLTNAVAVDIFPTKHRAMAVSLGMMMGRLGAMVGANVVGWLLQASCGVSFYVSCAILVFNGLLCLTLPARKNTKPCKVAAVEPKYTQTQEPI